MARSNNAGRADLLHDWPTLTPAPPRAQRREPMRHGEPGPATHHRAPTKPARPSVAPRLEAQKFLEKMDGWGDLDIDRSVPRGAPLWRAKLTAPWRAGRSRSDQVPVADERCPQ
jgi:hypothetical protein